MKNWRELRSWATLAVGVTTLIILVISLQKAPDLKCRITATWGELDIKEAWESPDYAILTFKPKYNEDEFRISVTNMGNASATGVEVLIRAENFSLKIQRIIIRGSGFIREEVHVPFLLPEPGNRYIYGPLGEGEAFDFEMAFSWNPEYFEGTPVLRIQVTSVQKFIIRRIDFFP